MDMKMFIVKVSIYSLIEKVALPNLVGDVDS